MKISDHQGVRGGLSTGAHTPKELKQKGWPHLFELISPKDHISVLLLSIHASYFCGFNPCLEPLDLIQSRA
jgi:hypothetical protein